ncbi:YncE family protein [Mycobacterium sp. 050134]
MNGRKAAHDRDGLLPDGAVRIAVGNGPISDIVADADGGRLLVTNYGHDSVSVIDPYACQVTDTIAGLSEPFAIATGRGGFRAFVSVATPAYDAIAVIDPGAGEVVATHPLAHRISDLAISRDGGHVYVGRSGPGGADLAILEAVTGRFEEVRLPAAGHTTACVRISPDGARAYVATNGPAGGQLVVLRAGGAGPRVINAVGVGLPIRDVALSPDGAVAYVASCAPDAGAVIDVVDTRAHKVTRTRKVGDLGGILTGLTMSGDGDRAYVVSDTGITVLCTLTHDVLGTVTATDRPSRVIESPDARRLYVADHSGAVTVVPVGSIPALGIDDEAAPRGLLLADLAPREPAFV